MVQPSEGRFGKLGICSDSVNSFSGSQVEFRPLSEKNRLNFGKINNSE
jgi:hypothetical protein